MEQKKYWQNFGELKSSEAYQDSLKDEFTEDLPFEAGTGLLETATPRRDFLKYLGFSTAAAMAARWHGPVVPLAQAPPAPLIIDALFGIDARLERLRPDL